jgi:hypothetical protein
MDDIVEKLRKVINDHVKLDTVPKITNTNYDSKTKIFTATIEYPEIRRNVIDIEILKDKE